MRRATAADLDQLLTLMTAFYAESGFTLDIPQATKGFAPLLADDSLGWVSLIEDRGSPVGFLVVTRGYSMEYSGPIAVLDDLFVHPLARNKGLARAAIAEVRDTCAAQGIRAVSVQVDPGNGPANAVYQGAGFTLPPDRQLLVLPLAAPSHVA